MKIIRKLIRIGGIDLKRHNKEYDHFGKMYDKYQQFTMIPKSFFIDNLDLCNQHKKLAGDFVECGVWRGGMAAAISEVLKKKDSTVHLFDSFEGLPPAQEIDGKEALLWQANTQSAGYFNNCTAEESYAIKAMVMAEHENFKIYKGWFQNTLQNFEKKPISILRLDGDWYDSIKICLDQLFPFVIEGGLVILDDYYTWDGCAKAVHDFLSHEKSPSRVHQWNNQVGYIIKKS